MNAPLYAPEISLGRDNWRRPSRTGAQIVTASGDGGYGNEKNGFHVGHYRTKKLLHGNGCSQYSDCLTCPFPVCLLEDRP